MPGLGPVALNSPDLCGDAIAIAPEPLWVLDTLPRVLPSDLASRAAIDARRLGVEPASALAFLVAALAEMACGGMVWSDGKNRSDDGSDQNWNPGSQRIAFVSGFRSYVAVGRRSRDSLAPTNRHVIRSGYRACQTPLAWRGCPR